MKFFKYIFLLLVIVGAFIAYNYYQKIFSPNTPDELQEEYLYIKEDATLTAVISQLFQNGQVLDSASFRWVAEKMNYNNRTIKGGKYLVLPSQSNKELISLLRSGHQAPVNITIRAARNIPHLAGMVSSQLSMDSLEFISHYREQFLPSASQNEENGMSIFIPNTYEFFWNTTPERFMDRMAKEHDRFWNGAREKKAKDLGLEAEEVYTLASIVERETQYNPEKPAIAGVYLNRLKKGMLLQADPTVIFAHQDFGIRRVLKRHLEIDSPYNTYKYTGLPPGPIYMPSISSIDAVLNPEDHKYIYFCAKPGGEGSHLFASSLTAHLRNARQFQSWLNNQGIR